MLCLCAFACAALPTRSRADSTQQLNTVRVKLSTNNATALAIGVNGEYFIEQTGLAVPKGTVTLRSNFNGTLSAIHSSEGELYTGSSVSFLRCDMRPAGGNITLNSRCYLGHIYASVLSSGYIRIINEVPLAHYLYGVVAYEMNNNYPIEALKAQAVAAKSYVLASIAQKPNAAYHIGDTSSDQVYKGYNSAYANVIAAVDDTITKVLTVNGSILTAYYSASNGGETTVPSTAWSGKKVSDAGFAVALDPYDAQNPQSMKETVTIPINGPGKISQQLYDMLLAKLTQYRSAQAQGISLIRGVELSDPKGKNEQRSMTMMTITVDGIFDSGVAEGITLKFNVSELLLYSVCTNSNLRSYWGEYSADGSSYTIYHVRWGHGVGLSQRGAQQRASSGQSYKEILAFYYPGAALSDYSITLPAAPVQPGSSQNGQNAGAADDGSGNLAAGSSAEGMLSIGTGVTTARVNLRSGAGTSFDPLWLMPKGTKLTVYDFDNGWYYATAEGKALTGFVIGDYVKFTAAPAEAAPSPTPTPAAAEPAAPTPTPAQGDNAAGSIATVDIGMVTGSGVNLRIGPDTSYKSIKKLAKNTLIIILAQEGKWARVIAGENEGYIYTDYVKITGTAVLDEPSAGADNALPSRGAGVTTGSVNLRQGAGTDTKKLATLKKGTELELITLENGWYHISCAAGEGYVSAKYVRVTAAIPDDAANADDADDAENAGADNPANDAPAAKHGAGVTTAKVNLRAGASTSAAKIALLKKGTELEIIALEGDWYQVICAAGEGYVTAQYVRMDKEPAAPEPGADAMPQPMGAGVTSATVNLREAPSTSSKILTQLGRGAEVTLYSLENGWYAAKYGEYSGYLYAKYVKQTAAAPADANADAPDTAPGVTPEGSQALPAAVELAQGKANAKVNMRTGASTSGTGVLCTLSAGSKLNILAEMGDWYYVLYDGRTGFCAKAYITVTSRGTADIYQGQTALTLISASIKSNVNFRTGPDTSYPIIRQLNSGEAAMVYMINGAWCLARCGDTWGYINKDYVKLR